MVACYRIDQLGTPQPRNATGATLHATRSRQRRAAPRTHHDALRLLRLATGLFLATVVIGTRWDRAWHATHPFEDFWSPPHIFLYTTLGLTAVTVARIAFSDDLRRWFGPGCAVPVLCIELPGAIVLAAGGLVLLGVAGLLDLMWHSTFGLDETGWSLPHALLGWGMLLTFLGLMSCRLALQPYRPLARYTSVVLGALALAFVTGVLLGPLGNNPTPEMVRRVAALPVLATEEPAQRTFRIYVVWNLTRTNPLFVPLAALAAGAGLALVRGLVRRPSAFLGVVLIVTLFSLTGARQTARYFDLAGDPRAWLPLPFLPAALVLVAGRRAGVAARRAWAAAGITFGAFAVLSWGAHPLLAPTAAPTMIVGAWAGTQVSQTLESPSKRSVTRLVTVAAGVSVLLGVVDLFLRTRTA